MANRNQSGTQAIGSQLLPDTPSRDQNMRNCGFAPNNLVTSRSQRGRTLKQCQRETRPHQPAGQHWSCNAGTRYENRFFAQFPFLSPKLFVYSGRMRIASTELQIGTAYPYTVRIGKLAGRLRVMPGPAVRQTTENKGTFILFEDRLSDSPFVERVWRCHSDRAGKFLSVAASHFEMAVTRYRGKTFLTLRGPETKATTLDCPAEGKWLCIRFKLGTFMPQLLPGSLRNQRDVTLPDATRRSFWLNGSAWQYPDFENAETFVKRLAKAGVISRDLTVDAALQGQPRTLSLRSAQRHFLRATGITSATFRQIERARYATNLLREGVSIVDAVHLAGYFDQAHLTRSLKQLIGLTPAKIIQAERQLSFLYKTKPPSMNL